MSLIALLVTLVVWALIFYVLWWGLGALALGEPFNKIATVILIVAVVVVAISILMGTIAPFPFITSLGIR